MSNSTTKRFKELLTHDDATLFYIELDKHAQSLRNKAHEMVHFIDHLSIQNKELNALKNSFHKFETMPLKHLSKGIDEIKEALLVINFLANKNKHVHSHQVQYLSLFDKQNQFNDEANTLVQKACTIGNNRE